VASDKWRLPTITGVNPGDYLITVLVTTSPSLTRSPSESSAVHAIKIFALPTAITTTRLNCARSEIPAVTHVGYSARIQTVRREVSPLYWEIMEAFRKKTVCPVIVNTSFNVRGEPIVCTPEDSYRCFMRAEMDALALET
jgi:predicted NodU family carbamoyl transferase